MGEAKPRFATRRRQHEGAGVTGQGVKGRVALKGGQRTHPIVVKQVDARAQWADQKVVEGGVRVVVVMHAEHAQPAADVQRGHPVPAAVVPEQNSGQLPCPRRVVVERCGVEVEDGLGHRGMQRQAKHGGEGVLPDHQVLARVKRPGALGLVDPLFPGGGRPNVAVIRAVNVQGVQQRLHAEHLRKGPSVHPSGVTDVQEHAVGHRVGTKIHIRRRQPQLGRERGLHPPKLRHKHAPHQPGAQFAGFKAVFAHGRKGHRHRVDDGDVKQFGGGLEPQTNVGFGLGAALRQHPKASEKNVDCRVDAGVVPLHEGTKFSKNLAYSATASVFPSRMVS